MMKLKLSTAAQMFTKAKAEEVAAMMNEGDGEDFRYVAKHDPKGTGHSFIEVFDVPSGDKIGVV